jgi:hypothetical protein
MHALQWGVFAAKLLLTLWLLAGAFIGAVLIFDALSGSGDTGQGIGIGLCVLVLCGGGALRLLFSLYRQYRTQKHGDER